jgi:hypothetical protein
MPGTETEKKNRTSHAQRNKVWLFISGIFLLLVVLAAVMYSKEMNAQTFWVVRVIVSLAAAGYGSFIPGAAKAEYSGAGYKITGALVVGAGVFFSFPQPEPPVKDVTIRGIVFVNGKKAAGVNVGTSGLTAADVTGDFGEFDFTLPQDQLPEGIMFDFRYNPPDTSLLFIDTSIRIAKSVFLRDSFEIRLTTDSVPALTITLAGTVYDEQNNGLAGVKVTALNTGTITGEGGLFHLALVTKTKKTPVSFSKNGYHTLTKSLEIPDENINATLRKK